MTTQYFSQKIFFLTFLPISDVVMILEPAVRKIYQVAIRRYSKPRMCDIAPPFEVRDMREWRPELFTCSALIPAISVTSTHIDKVRKILEKYVLKMRNIKPVQQCEKFPDRKSVLLSPEQVSSFRDLQPIHSSLEDFDVHQKHFRKV